MELTRRAVLGGALLPLALLPRGLRGQETTAPTLFIVLDKLPQTLPPDLVRQMIGVFLSSGIPVTATVPCTGRAALLPVLRQIAERERGLFELALEAVIPGPEPESVERYFQLRAGMELRDCLADIAPDPGVLPAPPVCLLDRSSGPGPNPYPLRAAGFRVVLRPGAQSGESRFEEVDWGIARLTGGQRAKIEDLPDAALTSHQSTRGIQTLYLSFAAAATLPPAVLLAQCRAWAARLQAAMLQGLLFPARPKDHLLQGNPGASKYVGLVLDFTGTPGPDSPILDFARQLDLAGIPYSVLAKDAALSLPEGVDICTFDPAAGGYCLSADLPGQSRAEIIVTHAKSPYQWSGPQADGRFHAALQPFGARSFAEMMAQAPLTDTLLLINGQGIAAPVKRAALIGEIRQAGWDGKASYYTLRGYMAQTLAPGPVLGHFWATRRRQALMPPAQPALAGTADLHADARLAWGFIERYTNPETGLCAGTVQTGPADTVNQWVALWDVASQMRGIAAAVGLSLIGKAAAQARLARVLDNLPEVRLDGHALPPALFRADNPAMARPEFNACDTGRFLIALSAMVEAGLVVQARAAAVVARWDIAAVVRAGKLYDFKNGGWQGSSASHCTQYARNGYAAWGQPVASAYTALTGQGTGDEKIRLLFRAANIGHFGTEPLLLEGLELGYSTESRYLADVLFTAQLAWYEQTGALKCVSETALDFDPWFAYQGLRVDREGAAEWVISTIQNNAANQTPEFYRRADIISAKAAYLWAALYPQPYSGRLLGLIREKARIEGLGFSVGVFAKTLAPMRGYSDINTNGVILAAIAKMSG